MSFPVITGMIGSMNYQPPMRFDTFEIFHLPKIREYTDMMPSFNQPVCKFYNIGIEGWLPTG
jgi:hypothetical protein